MKRVLSAAAAVVTIVMALSWETSLAEQSKKEIVGLTPDEVRWFTPPYYNDGRQRAQLFGDSSEGGTWIDRVKILAVRVSSRIRTRKTNQLRSSKALGIWARERNSTQRS